MAQGGSFFIASLLIAPMPANGQTDLPSLCNGNCRAGPARGNDASTNDLVVGLPEAQWGELDLLRQPVGDREITVALDKDTTHNEHRIVW